MPQVILTPVGSAGDVFPFVMLGRELRRRGHRVVVMAADPFRDVIVNSGLEFVSAGSREEFEDMTRKPELWDPRLGPRLVFGEIARHMRHGYAVLEQLFVPGDTLLVGHSLSVHTRVFEETHEVAAATVHLSPSVFRSDYRQPTLPTGHDVSNWPRWAKRTLWWAIDRFGIDPPLVPELNAWRHTLGLTPVSRVFKTWVHSPQLVLGLFPEWFADPQPDWPPQLHLSGFLLSDELGRSLPGAEQERLDRFMNSGAAPVVCTPGSANQHAATFFQTAIGAVARAGRRAVLITPYREHLPESLPADIAHFTYVPFSTLFPRAAAVVHHGGIGTSAQALAAGIPQLVMPMGFDQPDNAALLKRLNVADVAYPQHFTEPVVRAALDRLLTSEQARAACGRMRGQVNSDAALKRACDLLENRLAKPA